MRLGRIKTLFKYLFVFLLFFTIFFLFHISVYNLFGSDDSYYHTKHSWLIERSGKLDLVEPWLEFHFLNYAPTDPWWGYHLILAILIHFFGPILGTKLLASLNATLVFFVFYFLLDKLKIKSPFCWTFLFFSSSLLFQFRLLLERPFVFAMSVLPLSFWLMFKKKYFWLFLLSLVYTLFYNLSPLIIFIALAYIIVECHLTKDFDLKLLIISSGGILVGILIHPQSLNYLYIIFVHFWQVLYLKFSGIELGIGAEVQTISFFEFIKYNFIALLFFIIAIALLFILREKQDKIRFSIVNNFLFVFSSFWFLISLLIPRGADYWLPFAWLFIAQIFNNFFDSQEIIFFKIFIKNKINTKILSFFIYSLLFILIANNFTQIFISLFERNDSNQDYYFKQANEWLLDNTPTNSLIFYNNWSYWPMMFFYNHHNHYIVGMDPTFLYEYDKNLFWLWHNISNKGIFCDQAESCNNLSPKQEIDLVKSAVKEKFGSDYILINNDPETPLAKVLNNRKKDYAIVFKNKELVIYKIIN